MMNSRRLLLLGAIGGAAFALGSWLSSGPAPARVANPPTTASHPAQGNAPAHRETMSDVLSAIISQTQEPDPLLRLRRLREALDRVPEGEVAKVLDRIDRLPEPERRMLLGVVFTRLCSVHPEAASAWIRGLPKTAYSTLFGMGNRYLTIFDAWPKFAPEAALAEAQRFPEQFGHIFANVAIRQAHGQSDWRGSILAALQALPAGRLREKAAMVCVTGCAEDMAAAVQIGEAFLNPDDRRKAFFTAFETSMERFTGSDEQLAALTKIFGDKPAGLWGDTRVDRLLAYAAVRAEDPQRIAEWTLSLGDGARLPAAIEVVTEWSKRSGLAALDWARKNGVPVDTWNSDLSYRKGPKAEAPLIFAARKQPEKVAAWLAALPPGSERERLITYALHNPEEKFHATLRTALGR